MYMSPKPHRGHPRAIQPCPFLLGCGSQSWKCSFDVLKRQEAKPEGLTTGNPQDQNDISDIPPHPNTMSKPTSWVGGATSPPHNHLPFTCRQAFLQPDIAGNYYLLVHRDML